MYKEKTRCDSFITKSNRRLSKYNLKSEFNSCELLAHINMLLARKEFFPLSWANYGDLWQLDHLDSIEHADNHKSHKINKIENIMPMLTSVNTANVDDFEKMTLQMERLKKIRVELYKQYKASGSKECFEDYVYNLYDMMYKIKTLK